MRRKAGDSLQWGKDIFRDKFRDKVQDKVQDWSDSSQEILANMQATAASILNKQQRRMINAFRVCVSRIPSNTARSSKLCTKCCVANNRSNKQ